VDVAVCELVDKTGLPPTATYFSMLSGEAVFVPLPYKKVQFDYVYGASVPSSYVTNHMCTPSKVENAGTAQSTAQQDDSYVVMRLITVDGLTLAIILLAPFVLPSSNTSYFTSHMLFC
jgi:hypothetical protein